MEFSAFLPETIVVAGASILLLLSLIGYRNKKYVNGILAMLIPIIAFIIIAFQAGSVSNLLFVQDGFAQFARGLLSLISLPILLSSFDMFSSDSKRQGEFLFLMLISLSGLMLLCQASSLMIVYLAIEISSIPLYMLAGFRVGSVRSKEAVVKYFLLGAFASAVTIYGMSLVYSTTHTLAFSQLAQHISPTLPGLTGLPIEYAGLIFIFAGLFFKIAAFPFHFWAPDVYEGSPPISTAFISVAPKIGVVVLMARFVGFAIPSALSTGVAWVVMSISAVTMTFGNITAIWQNNVKRIFAYSSIAQVGYILMGVAVIAIHPGTTIAKDGAIGILMYLTAYALMNIAGFSIIKVVESRRGGSSLKNFAGLGKTNPALSIAMVVTLVSLLGIPWTAGFFGKLFVFKSAINASLYWLVILAVVNSAISAFYYFGIVKYMYLKEPDESIEQSGFSDVFSSLSSGICSVGTAVLIMVPGLIPLIEKACRVFGD